MDHTTAQNPERNKFQISTKRKKALKFVLMIVVVSFFADLTYEGSRSITGPFLLTLGASGAVVTDKGIFPLVFGFIWLLPLLVAAGFADFQLIAYHFVKAGVTSKTWGPIFYSVAMAVSGTRSLVFGKLFDRFGIAVLIPLTLITALSAPLVFLGGFWLALAGIAVWGLGMSVHESIIAAAVATMAPANRRPSAYGLFTGTYGVFWFVGIAIIGILYDHSIPAVITFCVIAELAAIPLFLKIRSQQRQENPAETS